MQEKIQIISDGSLDLSRELTRERDILVVPFYVSFDGETYLKEGVELDIREFYQRMVDHPDVFPKTSMPSVDDYYQVFLPLAKQDVPMIWTMVLRRVTRRGISLLTCATSKVLVQQMMPTMRTVSNGQSSVFILTELLQRPLHPMWSISISLLMRPQR